MSTLAELQRGFQAAVLGHDEAVLARVAVGGGASAEERLRIYADGMRLRFLEVLSGDFPGVRALLGEADFAVLAHAYALACPSRAPSIRWFGARLAHYLHTAPWSTRPELSEMAAFEWAKGELHDAADSPVLGVSAMAGVPPEEWAGLHPRLVPALRRLNLRWNVPAVYAGVERGDVPAPAVQPEEVRGWLLWRRELRVHWRSLDRHEAWALDALAAGASFGELCAGLGERMGEREAPLRAASALKQWLSDGLIAAV